MTMGEPKRNKKVKYDEAVKDYSPQELKQHHDDCLTYYIEHKGEVSVKVLSRVGKVPQSYIRAWMKDENWDQYVMEDSGDKVQVSEKTKQFIESAAEKYGLTEQEELFCYHYFKCKNATQAAMKAGYSSAWSYNAGYKLLNKPKIKEFLKDLRAQACEEIFVDTLDILRMWAKIAFADMNDYVSVSGAGVMLKGSSQTDGQVITEIKEGKDGITIKMADKMKALDRLSSYFQVLPGDKAQEAKLRILEKAASSNEDDDEPLKIEIVGV
jgi:phage terminase small subunit